MWLKKLKLFFLQFRQHFKIWRIDCTRSTLLQSVIAFEISRDEYLEELEYINDQYSEDIFNLIFSKVRYDNRYLPKLTFTKDWTVDGKVFYLEGEEYPPFMWNYERMIRLLKAEVIKF